MIRAAGLSIGYQKGRRSHAVQTDLNLRAVSGSLVAILGPNGCGKSTLLRTLGGLQPPLSGDVLIDNRSLHFMSLAERAKVLAMVLTDSVQVVYMTVWDMVSMGRHPYSTLSGRLTDTDRERVEWALGVVNMPDFRTRYVQELSDGERQRVMIAKALAQDTPIILLDEPTSHLDLPNRIETLLLLRKLTREFSKTILISTHEIDLAMRLASHVWLMHPTGGIVVGEPADLMANGSIQAAFHSENFGFDAQTGRVIVF